MVQGVNEEITYDLDTTPWGDSPSGVSVVVNDLDADYEDVTTTVMPSGSATAAANIITLPELKLLTVDHRYHVHVLFTVDSGQLCDAVCEIRATR